MLLVLSNVFRETRKYTYTTFRYNERQCAQSRTLTVYVFVYAYLILFVNCIVSSVENSVVACIRK